MSRQLMTIVSTAPAVAQASHCHAGGVPPAAAVQHMKSKFRANSAGGKS